MRVKSVEKSATDARIQESADAFEKPCRVRPGDVVQIARDDAWQIRFADGFADKQKLAVAFERARIFAGHRRARMNAVQRDASPVRKLDLRVNRGNIVLNQ